MVYIIYKLKVYSKKKNNGEASLLSHILPNQIKTNKISGLYFSTTSGKGKYLARFYSSSSNIQPKLNKFNPFFITGLTDAEGSFSCIIKKSAGHRLGWRV